MAAPNVNGRLHLTGVHQKPPASLLYPLEITVTKLRNASAKP